MEWVVRRLERNYKETLSRPGNSSDYLLASEITSRKRSSSTVDGETSNIETLGTSKLVSGDTTPEDLALMRLQLSFVNQQAELPSWSLAKVVTGY